MQNAGPATENGEELDKFVRFENWLRENGASFDQVSWFGSEFAMNDAKLPI
jgi:hypothetical protein